MQLREKMNNIYYEEKFKNMVIKQRVLTMLIVITVIQQFPFFLENFYGEIRDILYVMFAITTACALLNRNILKNNIVKIMFFIVLYTAFISLIALFGNFNFRLDGVIELLIPLGILLSSLNIKFTTKNINKVIDIYVFLATILGVISILYYGVGLEITQTYSIKSKNQIGPVIGIAIIITLYNIFNYSKREIKGRYYSIINLIEFITLFVCLIVFRSRSSLLAVVVLMLIMLVNFSKKKLTYRNVFIIIVIIIMSVYLYSSGYLTQMIKFIWDSFTKNYNISDLNSLSAGRTDGYMEAIKFSFQNPLFGQLINNISLNHSIHNYILNKWIRYGIIGSLPMILFYLYLWKESIKNIFINRKNKKNNLVFYLFIFSLVVSIFEYTYPYGPGVSQIMIWFLLGQYLNDN
ncbi:hypothetical protein Cp4435_02247 [Clostridium perfringens]|uniref:O-antigen ligase family protein n=1 Tax=Clostridium perfringens TaxID=1502 RepID=UPI002443CE8B|nr:hypothetical protein [Clostridium perfringens]MDG6885050.1 hypothetical protein [Clostridium perfringens]